MRKLVLASQSPRRKELLEKAGFVFHTCSVNLSEFLEKNLTIEAALFNLAKRKVQAVLDTPNLLNSNGKLILGADTIVVLGNEVLGKPADAAQAVVYLKQLSGQKHRVMTSIAIYDDQTKVWDGGVETSWVTFRKLSDSEIDTYVKSGEPMDKAGAYAIQGLGSRFVQSLEGSLDNVIGLPMQLLMNILERNSWHVDFR